MVLGRGSQASAGLAQSTPTPECEPGESPSKIEIAITPSQVRVGDIATLSIRYTAVFLPYLYFHVWPDQLLETEPPLRSPCRHDEHPTGCQAITFQARATGVVTATAYASGEIVYCEEPGRWVFAWGATATKSAVAVVGPPEPLPDLRATATEYCHPGLELRIENVGDADAGQFSVSGVNLRLEGLRAGESTSYVVPDPHEPIVVDSDNEVVESDESNNEAVRIVPGCRWLLPDLRAGRQPQSTYGRSSRGAPDCNRVGFYPLGLLVAWRSRVCA